MDNPNIFCAHSHELRTLGIAEICSVYLTYGYHQQIIRSHRGSILHTSARGQGMEGSARASDDKRGKRILVGK